MRQVSRVLVLLLLFSVWFPMAVAEAKDELTMQQMKVRGEKLVAQMREMRDVGESGLRKARGDKDLSRMDCINEALIALKGVLKLGEDYLYDMKAEYDRGNRKGVQSSYVKITIAMKKIESLDARLRSCGGPHEEGVVEGKPIIERTMDSDLPNQDPLEGLESDPMFVERPPVASPYD